MSTVKINHLNLFCPEGFSVIPEEEMRGMNMLKEGDGGEMIRDPERHIVISAGWKKHGGLISILVSNEEGIESMEKQIAKAMKANGYVRDTFTSESIGSREAQAVIYRYEVQDIKMSAESMIIKDGDIYYYIHCYYRTNSAEESRKVLKEIFDGSSWD